MVELDGVLAPLCQWYNYRGEREDADDRSRTPDFPTSPRHGLLPGLLGNQIEPWWRGRWRTGGDRDRDASPVFNTATCFIHDVAQRRGPINLDRFLGRVAPDDDRIEIELIGTKRRMTIEI